MKAVLSLRLRCPGPCALLLLLSATALSSGLAQRDPLAASKLEDAVLASTADGTPAEFLVVLSDQADLSFAAMLRTKEEKGRFVYETLWRKAQQTQEPLRAWLRSREIEHRCFYIVNALWVRASREIALAIAERPEVDRIESNTWVRGIALLASPEASPPAPLTIEPNIAYTGADQVWAMGYTGQGVVVGGQDTGYQWDHPALIRQYRGWNGATADHDYNWHDSIHSGGGVCGVNSPFPCDDDAHGTHTMGTVLGDDGFGNQIGMAPGARFICSRNMDQGWGSPATYLESFEFFLAPYPVGGTPAQGNPSLAPDVTSNSWLCPPSEGCSTGTLLLAAQAQRAAGIVTVVAAGNSGSSCSTVTDPCAIYDEVYSIGAISYSTGSIAYFSSRGPVTSDGSGRMKPDLTAPGRNIRSSVPGGGYAGGWNGTSMATPHVAGAVALLISAHPALRGQVDVIEQILNDTADHVSSSSCSSSGWPNNVYGHGRLDVFAAVNAVCGVALSAPVSAKSGAAGALVTYSLTVTNDGYLDDSVHLSVGGSSFPASVAPTLLGPVPAHGAATATVTVQIPSGTSIGTVSPLVVTATSSAFPAKTASSTLTTTCNSGCILRNGTGVNPTDYSCITPPVLGTSWVTGYGANASTLSTVLVLSLAGAASGPAFANGEFLVSLVPPPIMIPGSGNISLPIPSDPILYQAQVATQGARLDSGPAGIEVVLLNALDIVLGS